jgi:hypothetical protein
VAAAKTAFYNIAIGWIMANGCVLVGFGTYELAKGAASGVGNVDGRKWRCGSRYWPDCIPYCCVD